MREKTHLRRRVSILFLVVLLSALGVWFRHRQIQRAEIAALQEDCVSFESRSDWKKLEAASSIWLNRTPEDPTAQFLKGKAIARNPILSAERADSSLKLLEAVTPASARHQESLELQLGLLFGILNRVVDARQLAEQTLSVYPTSAPTRMMYSNYLLMIVDRQALLNQLYDAMDSESDLPVHFGYLAILDSAILNDRTPVLQHWQRGAPDDKTLKVGESVSKLLTATAKRVGNINDTTQETVQQAVRHVEPFLADTLVNPIVVRELLLLRIESADLKGVSELLQIGYAGAEQDPFYWRARGWYRMMLDEFDLAESDLQKARSYFPFSWKTHNELAALYRRMGRPDAAESMQAVADRGRDVESSVLTLARLQDMDREYLTYLRDYAQLCRDDRCVQALDRRLAPSEQLRR